MPKVSFILPAYKRPFLGKAIESILGQSFQDWELIVINDCSPENLAEVVSNFSDERLFYFENAENKGRTDLVGHWNECIKKAKGEFIVMASDDDYYEPDYLEKMIALSIQYPNVNLFHGRIRYVNENGEMLLLSQPASPFETQVDFVYQRLCWQRKQVLQEFMFRKDAFERERGFVKFPIAWYTDDATWNKIATKGVAYTNEVLFNFRMSGANLSTSSVKGKEKIIAMKEYIKWLESFLPTISPQSHDDEVLLNILKKEYKSIVFGHYWLYLPALSWHDYFKEIKYMWKESVFPKQILFTALIRRLFKK